MFLKDPLPPAPAGALLRSKRTGVRHVLFFGSSRRSDPEALGSHTAFHRVVTTPGSMLPPERATAPHVCLQLRENGVPLPASPLLTARRPQRAKGPQGPQDGRQAMRLTATELPPHAMYTSYGICGAYISLLPPLPFHVALWSCGMARAYRCAANPSPHAFTRHRIGPLSAWGYPHCVGWPRGLTSEPTNAAVL